ncbi:MAG: tRNA (adenosine(37)-N6)-threonylcarbamoyltransferase complex ATPase subunit type 1 TsaE [bacterium]
MAKLCSPPFLIELVGDLGGGKTALVKAIAKGLGITQTVTSPSYNIHRSYSSSEGTKLEHFDLYRLNDDEIVQNELIDALADDKAIVCVEWAQHFAGHSSDNRLTIECHYESPSSRRYEISGFGKAAQTIISELKR